MSDKNWMGLTREELISGLMHRFMLNERLAQGYVNRLNNLHLNLRDNFMRLWKTGMLSCDIEVEGWTVQKLMDQKKFIPINALATIDWLLREPEEAAKALQQRMDAVFVDAEDMKRKQEERRQSITRH